MHRDELSLVAHEVLAGISRASHAMVIALSGDLGAGKTTFTQEVAKVLGVEEHVVSPTFVIQKIYALKEQKFDRLIHIDAYRLESARELEHLGWHDLCADPGNLILIEWPERVTELIPADAVRIALSHGEHEHERHITVVK